MLYYATEAFNNPNITLHTWMEHHSEVGQFLTVKLDIDNVLYLSCYTEKSPFAITPRPRTALLMCLEKYSAIGNYGAL